MMKRLFIISACALLTAASFTSCNSSDDNGGNSSLYTKVDKATVMAVLRGNYEGKLYYYSSENSVFKQDSTDAKWTVNADTTITYTFPVKLLANFCIKTSTQGVADKALLAAASDQNLTASITIPATMLNAYYELGDYFAGLTPKSNLTQTASDGTKITVEFTTNDIKDGVTGETVYSMMEYYKLREKAVFLIKDVKVGDNTYTVNCPFWLLGNKKSSIIEQ
jgi:YHS domain-containing protein